MDKAQRQLKHWYRVYYLGRSSVEGDPSKRARAHCHIQAWARHRGLVEKYQEGHCLPNCPWHISRMIKVSHLQGGGV
jgi:hypothetical protein